MNVMLSRTLLFFHNFTRTLNKLYCMKQKEIIMSPNPSIILTILSWFMCYHQVVQAVEHYCTNVQELRQAMTAVQAGDEIILANGTMFTATDTPGSGIGAHFSSNVNAVSDQRIIMRSESPDNPATLSGDQISKRHVLRLFGDYWTIKDIIFTYAQKGIVLDQANNVHIVGCEVYNIGMEAIHMRDGSQNTLVEDCYIHDTGKSNPSFGEAIYVGSDKKKHGEVDPHINGTVVRGCTIGPNVGAEAFDIKEGTAETIIENNIVDATGISGANYADSFVDLKGTRTYVRYNIFNSNCAPKLNKAIALVDRGVDMSTYEHTIHDNVFHLDGCSRIIPMIHAYDFRDTYAFNNLPVDGVIADGVYKTCCPPWYTPPRNRTIVCVPPVGYFSSFVTNTSAVLSWNGYAVSFTVSYNKFGSPIVQEVSTFNTTLLLDDLEYNATYEWKVKSNCASSESAFSGVDTFTTGKPDGGPPPYSDGSAIIYDEDLGDFWNDYSFSMTAVDFADTSDYRYGSKAIKCTYGNYGGLNLVRSETLDARNFTNLSFWAKGDSTANGAGDVAMRLKVNGDTMYFSILNDVWQNYQFSLSNFKNPESIDSIVIQNDVGAAKVVWFDQIELLRDLGSEAPTPFPTTSPTKQPVYVEPTSVPSESPSNFLSKSPSLVPTTSLKPSDRLSEIPSLVPTNSVSAAPSRLISSDPSSAPQESYNCGSVCIYGEASLDPAWTAQYSFKCDFDLAYEAESVVGNQSIRVSYFGSYGALYLKNKSGLNTSGLSFLQFWMKGEGAGYGVRVKVNGSRYTIHTSTTWQLVQISLAEFSNPQTIYKIYFQNESAQNRVIYYDGVSLL